MAKEFMKCAAKCRKWNIISHLGFGRSSYAKF